ncbi:MAG: hypothetical protein HY537_18255 [Deltaproteobacteria bacterium]|nr:hypothetical protein [Deltaproteobacteria bacterium]
MRLLKCPKPDALLEYLSIPSELSTQARLFSKIHLVTCSACKERAKAINARLDEVFSPEPDVTSSLLKVYGRLQRDETLILKGWKLGEFRASKQPLGHWLVQRGWAFRGAVVVVLISVMSLLAISQLREDRSRGLAMQAGRTPYAQIRIENENSLKVHYVRPELLQSIEFETTGSQWSTE